MNAKALLHSPLILLVWGTVALAQEAVRAPYMNTAIIDHRGGVAVVTANAPEPLRQAIQTLRAEYGLKISYETAPETSSHDLGDVTAPKWRARHPHEKGIVGYIGGPFNSTINEIDPENFASVQNALTRLVDDYNGTRYAGRYVLRSEADGAFVIIGNAVVGDDSLVREVKPPLDTEISIPAGRHGLHEAVHLWMSALSSALGQQVVLMSYPNNEFRDTEIELESKPISAREMLKRIIAKNGRPFIYDFGFDPNGVWILNIQVASKAHKVANGIIFVPLDRAR